MSLDQRYYPATDRILIAHFSLRCKFWFVKNYFGSGVPKSLPFFLLKNQLYFHFIFVMFLGFVSKQGIRMLIAGFVLLAQDHLIVLVNLMCPLETFPLKDFC